EKTGPVVSSEDRVLVELHRQRTGFAISPEHEYLRQLWFGELVDVIIGALLEIERVAPFRPTPVRPARPMKSIFTRRQQQQTLSGLDPGAQARVLNMGEGVLMGRGRPRLADKDTEKQRKRAYAQPRGRLRQLAYPFRTRH